MNGQLIVKSTPQNIKIIKDVLGKIDSALRNLQITVRQGRLKNLEEHDRSVSAEIPIGNRGRIEVDSQGKVSGSVGESDSDKRSSIKGVFKELKAEKNIRNEQRVVTLEGRPAVIYVSQIIPVNQSRSIVSGGKKTIESSVVFQNVTTGFTVLPHLQGENVILHINPVLSELKDGRQIETQSAGTTLSGRLNEWIEVGGILQNGTTSSRGISQRSNTRKSDSGKIYLRVEVQ